VVFCIPFSNFIPLDSFLIYCKIKISIPVTPLNDAKPTGFFALEMALCFALAIAKYF